MALAQFQDGKTSGSSEVELHWGTEGLEIRSSQDQSVLELWPYDEIRQIIVPGDEKRMRLSLGFGPGARLIITDLADIGQIRYRCPDLSRKAGRERGWWHGYAVWGSGAIISVVALFLVVIPALSESIVGLIPIEWERKFGLTAREQVLSVLRHTEGGKENNDLICTNQAGQAALDKMMARLTSLEEGPKHHSIIFVDSKIPNAIALPGEQMMFFRGLLDKADSPNAVAGVIAHELGHIRKRDSMSKLVESSAISMLLGLVLGDVTGGVILVGVGETAMNASYSRDKESRADDYAIALMNKGNYDIRPLSKLLNDISKGSGHDHGAILDWLSSHPATGSRTDRMHEDGTGKKQILNDAEWKALKNICAK